MADREVWVVEFKHSGKGWVTLSRQLVFSSEGEANIAITERQREHPRAEYRAVKYVPADAREEVDPNG